MHRLFFIPIFLTVLFSCKKEPIHEAAPSMIGSWKHYSAEEDWHVIHVYEDGNGAMEWYRNNKLYKDTKTRPWLMKGNTMHFGKVALNGELYDIEAYPDSASTEFIVNHDTIPALTRFVILDGFHYVEIE